MIRINKKQYYMKIYRFLYRFPFSKNYVDRLSYHYRMTNPCDSEIIAIKTVLTCLLVWGISIFAFLFIFLNNPRFITLITTGFTIWITNLELVSRISKTYEIIVLRDLQKLIAMLAHNYFVNYRVDDALYHSLEIQSMSMKGIVRQIYQILTAENKEELLAEYYDNIPNKFLRTFVNQCAAAMERWEPIGERTPVFIQNLDHLQREIDIENDKLQRINMEFLGVILCVTAPVFCIDIVKQFAIHMKENMETFFYGRNGFFLDIAFLWVITLIYSIMRKSAEYAPFKKSRHSILLFFERRYFIRKVLKNYFEKNASRMEGLKIRLKHGGYDITEEHFVLRSILSAAVVFIISIILLLGLKLKEGEYFSVTDLLISLGLAGAAYHIPYLWIRWNRSVTEDTMEDEVNQLNALISMLIYVDTMTVKQILEEMEAFAVVFRPSIQICLNNYGSGDFRALEELKEREPYEPFTRIIDNLIRSDSIPIHQAFHESTAIREGYVSKRKLSNEKSIKRRVFRAYVLAAVPFLILFAYGLVPTLIMSMAEINEIIQELDRAVW